MTEGRPEPPPKLVLDFVHASLPKPKRYELTVLGPTSQPVAGATVVRTSGLVRTTTQTDERGQFVIEVGWNETVNPPSIVKDDLFWPAIELWRRVNNGWLEYAASHRAQAKVDGGSASDRPGRPADRGRGSQPDV
jgi:hypothetical protein